MSFVLQNIIGVVTLLMLYFAGNHDRRAWYVNLFANGLWWALIFVDGDWGFVPLNVAVLFLTIRNIKVGKEV